MASSTAQRSLSVASYVEKFRVSVKNPESQLLSEREWQVCVCVRVCVCVCVCVCVILCVLVCVQKERENKWAFVRDRLGVCVRVCVCVCVCVRVCVCVQRKGERVSVCVCVCVRERERGRKGGRERKV